MEKKKSSIVSDSSTKTNHKRTRSFMDSLFNSSDHTKQLKRGHQFKQNMSCNMKPIDSIKITQQNFRQVLVGLTHQILTGNIKGKPLLDSVVKYLKSESPQLDQEVQAMLTDISYKKDTFDLLTSLKTIEAQIMKSVHKKNNPIGKIVFNIWYEYLERKYDSEEYKDFKKYYIMDIQTFKQFFATVVYHIYGEWLFLVDKKKNIYPYIYKQYTPYLLASHVAFSKVYKHVLRHLGQTSIKMDRNKTPTFFRMKPQFSCQYAQKPFEKTVQVVVDFYKESNLKKKIVKIKQIGLTLKQETRKSQQQRISKGLQKDYLQIDTDNMTDCLNYCILKSGCDGVSEACDYLQLFFLDQGKTDSSEYLYNLKIGHIMATLQTSGRYLKELDLKEQ